MRLRNVKNKEEILSNSNTLATDPFSYKGRWHSFFQNNHPIFIEIGMGKGKFITENAKMYPDINFIGIEKYDSVIVRAVEKIEEVLPNLVFIRMDASSIQDVFDHEIAKIYLNFSDPWPKKRHALRRLSSPLFLEKYETLFQDQKEIEMRTDNKDLYEYSLVSFKEAGYTLKEISLNLHQEKPPLVTTEYEDKFSEQGNPIYYVLCQKKD